MSIFSHLLHAVPSQATIISQTPSFEQQCYAIPYGFHTTGTFSCTCSIRTKMMTLHGQIYKRPYQYRQVCTLSTSWDTAKLTCAMGASEAKLFNGILRSTGMKDHLSRSEVQDVQTTANAYMYWCPPFGKIVQIYFHLRKRDGQAAFVLHYE